jgi:integrase
VLRLILFAIALCKALLPARDRALLERLFDPSVDAPRPKLARPEPGGCPVRLTVDAAIARQLAATLRTAGLHAFAERIGHAQQRPAGPAALQRACGALARALCDLVLRNDVRLAACAVRLARDGYGCRLRTGSREDKLRLVRVVNHELRALATRWQQMAAGLTTIDHELPPVHELLPLARFWGTPLAEAQRARLAGHPGYSLARKVEGVARRLDPILGAQAVEHLTPAHVVRFHASLAGRHAATQNNLLQTLKGLVRPYAAPEALAALDGCMYSEAQVAQLRARRAEFEMTELGQLLASVFRDRSLPPGDRVIVALLALTGARTEEICGLRSDSLRDCGAYWTVSIELTHEEKQQYARLLSKAGLAQQPRYKNTPTLRTIPVDARAIAGLHEQLVLLTAAPGFLFKHLDTTLAAHRRSTAFNARINRRIKECFGTASGKVLEGLRATVATRLAEDGCDGDYRRAYLGHAALDVHARHYLRAEAQHLLPLARSAGRLVRRALQGHQFPRLDARYVQVRRVLQQQPRVLGE